jgi:ribosomal protein S18 acetylase RimI-like enzyme
LSHVTTGAQPILPGSAALRLATRRETELESDALRASVLSLSQAGEELLLFVAESSSVKADRLLGAVLAQVLIGRAAVVWPPQTRLPPASAAGSAAERHKIALDLLASLHTALAARGVHLAQVVAAPGNSVESDVWPAAGYLHAGQLLYMAIPAAVFPDQPPSLPCDLLPALPGEMSRLATVMSATYRGSLDCPVVDGLRQPADILAGYRAVGVERPEWWLIARAESGADAGCLIMADHPEENQAELVYLGIAPEWRGKGWGRALTRQALWLAGRVGRDRLVLAVDAANGPARTQYEAAGGVIFDRRDIWVQDLRNSPSH